MQSVLMLCVNSNYLFRYVTKTQYAIEKMNLTAQLPDQFSNVYSGFVLLNIQTTWYI